MKNAVFWDVTPCGSCKNRYFGATIASIIRLESRRFFARFSETSVVTSAALRHIQEDGILHVKREFISHALVNNYHIKIAILNEISGLRNFKVTLHNYVGEEMVERD
jgi:hypothetical protein